jgi:hypothetical protein
MALEIAAIIIITENKLPAATSDSEKLWRISGNAMPKVATIIEGIKLAQGMMATDRRSGCADEGEFGSAMLTLRGDSYFNGMKTSCRGWPPTTRVI